MGSPFEAPLGADSAEQVNIESIQFIPPHIVKLEFSHQIRKKILFELIFTDQRAVNFVDAEPEPRSANIWYVSAKVTKNGRYPIESVRRFLTPEIVKLFLSFDVDKQAVLTKDEWLAKSYAESKEQENASREYYNTLHPVGKTYKGLLNMEHGWYDYKDYYIWRGRSKDGIYSAEVFQSFKITKYENYNRDIRSYLDRGLSIREAIRGQDADWMRNFYTMLGAFANTLASAQPIGPRPRLTPKGTKPLKKTSPPAKQSKGGGAIDKAAHGADKALELAANASSTYESIMESAKHWRSVAVSDEFEKLLSNDIEQVTTFITTTYNANVKRNKGR